MMEESEITGMIERMLTPGREGTTFVNDPNDAGGATKFGITLATLKQERGGNATTEDVRNLTMAEAVAIYRKTYFSHPRLRLAEWPYRRLAEAVFDFSVMHSRGAELGAKWAQESINRHRPAKDAIAVDGWIGPATLQAMAMVSESHLLADHVIDRLALHLEVIRQNFQTRAAGATKIDQAANAGGWTARALLWREGRKSDAAEVVEPAPTVKESLTPRWLIARLAKDGAYQGRRVYWSGSIGPSGGFMANMTLHPQAAVDFPSREEAQAALMDDDRLFKQGYSVEPAP